MYRWKTTDQILKNTNQEHFNENWMDRDTVYTPPFQYWDYKDQLSVEKVSLWEILFEQSSSHGMIAGYAAWDPYAEYYILTVSGKIVIEFYGKNSNKEFEKFLIFNNIYYPKSNFIYDDIFKKTHYLHLL